MKNLSGSLKKFLGNKNTVTILGVVLIVAILGIGYNARINQKTSLREVPVANQKIEPRTKIKEDMIKRVNVPAEFLVGSFYENTNNIVGKYTNYNVTLAEGSLFYVDLLVDKTELPELMFGDLEEGYRPYVMNLETATGTYGGPEDYLDIYFSATENGKIVFGELLEGIEILAVVDGSGKSTYGTNSDNSEEGSEAVTSAALYLAVPERIYLLLNRASRLNEVVENYNSYFVITPHGTDPKTVDNIDVYLTSNDLEKFINDHSKEVDTNRTKIETKENN